MADFAAWTADSSQQTNIELIFDADISYSPPPETPPTHLNATDFTILRVSFTMPAVTLDSDGRPT